jgi:glycosyltransferase involved in cell wall biosynthesis
MRSKYPAQIIIWGSYDTGKPRVRLLVKAAALLGYQVTEIHNHIWDGVEDKSLIKRVTAKMRMLFTLILAYPGLIYRYFKAPKHSHVIVPYLGVFDIIILWPFAKLRGAKIHWDMFISLYDTVVNDRKIMSRYHPAAWVLYGLEWLACRLAGNVFMDTAPHAAYIERLYILPTNTVEWIPVGVEASHFPRQPYPKSFNPEEIDVLFYGQFIPLHGIDSILDAALLDKSGCIHWTIVGNGQLSTHIDERIDQEGIKSIRRINWVDYENLVKLIQKSDICLGIFGTSQKAQNVIPNKLYQIMAAGKPFVTANTPGMKSIELNDNIAVALCKPGDAASLYEVVRRLASQIQQHPQQTFQAALKLPIIDATVVSIRLERVLNCSSI